MLLARVGVHGVEPIADDRYRRITGADRLTPDQHWLTLFPCLKQTRLVDSAGPMRSPELRPIHSPGRRWRQKTDDQPGKPGSAGQHGPIGSVVKRRSAGISKQ